MGFQDAAISPIIAGGRSLCSGRAGTGDIFEIEIAGADKIPEAARGFCSQQALCLASRSPCLRRIEAYEPDVRLLLIDADRVAIDHANVVGVDGFADGWY